MRSEQPFACFVINLDGSDDRLRSISDKLDAAGMAFTRLSAVDGRGFDPDRVPDYDPQAAQRYMGRALVGGEIGCYHSHLAAARAFLESGASWGLILEDDSDPDPELRRVVEKTIGFLDAHDPDWRIVNLGNHKLKIAMPCHAIATARTRYVLHQAFYFPMTTGAILWSRKGARDFVEGHGAIFAPVDNFLRHWITRAGGGYAFAPRPVNTTEAESDIAQPSATPRSRTRRSALYGFRKQRRLLVDKLIALARKRRTPAVADFGAETGPETGSKPGNSS